MTDPFDKISARQFVDFERLNDEDDTFFDNAGEDETLIFTDDLVANKDESVVITEDPLAAAKGDCIQQQDNDGEDETLIMTDDLVANNDESLVITDDPLAAAKGDCIQQQGIAMRASDLSNSSATHSVIILDEDDDDDSANPTEENGDDDLIGYHNSFNEEQQLRKSLSVGDIFYLEMAQENQRVWESRTSVSSCSTYTYENSPPKNASKGSLRKFSPIKKQYASDRNLNSYVPLAEAVRNFQITTPKRFHSRSKPELRLHTEVHPIKPTVPHTPHLVCNKRHRPLNVLSREEEELKEYEEAQKFKFKAHPVNKKILQRPVKVLPQIVKKPSTIPEPFHLAPVKPKVAEEPPRREPEFQAKPAPDFNQKPPLKKHLYQKSTKPQTPSFMRRLQKKQDKPLKPEDQIESIKPIPYPIRSLPLSFQLRNQYLLKKKEKCISQFIEEEKKAREFHARPVPKHILASPKISKTSTKTVELRSKVTEQKLKTSIENVYKGTKSKPVKTIKKPLTEVQEFTLYTNLRAKERKAFEEQLKAKEEMAKQLQQEEEAKRLKEEHEKTMKFRKMAEVKAQPIRKFKEVHIQPSGKVTMPVSPKFHSNIYKKRLNRNNKENEATLPIS